MNKELMDALEILEREREISREALFEAISNSLVTACKNHFKSAENIRVDIDNDTCDFHVIATKEIIELADDVMDPAIEISLEDARKIDPNAEVGGTVEVEINSKEFGRIATQNAKNVITQKIREEERNVIFNQFQDKIGTVMTGVVQRRVGKNLSINLGKADALLTETEMVPGEIYRPNDRIKVYVLGVKNESKGAKITVSRSYPDLVRCLFESEVTEIQDGIVVIKDIAREPGSRTKMSVYSTDPNVDPVGACVGVKGERAKAIVDELRGEKIDIICHDENPGNLIRNALSPAEIVNVFADTEAKTANVVVPDDQLSLAIGKSGQNARLAAKLTKFKIDIKSETQAKDAYGFRYEDYLEDDEYYDDEYYDGEYEESEYEDGEYIDGEYEEDGDFEITDDSGAPAGEDEEDEN